MALVNSEKSRLHLFDTTLRDGAQTNGVDFTLADKLAIAGMLDELGVDYIEAGYPGANPIDTQFFAERRPGRAKITAFGMTRRPGRSAANDLGLAALLAAEADAICFVAKSWDYHVRVALETTAEENLASIRDSVRAAKAKGREALLDCEHFFDGYKANAAYALACARQIQGTLNGLGERCGNANLVSIIPTLKLKADYAEKFDIGVSDQALARIARVSHALDDLLNRAADRHAPYVGESAFATKAGIHASAIMKDPATYEHVAPERVGNKRKLLVSDQSGRSNVLAELERIGLAIDKDDPRVTRLLEEVKEREAIGYAYEAADASFDLLARRMLGQVPHYFDVEKFDVNVEQRRNGRGEPVTVSQAVVKIKVGEEELISVAEGIGPVNALDLALRKDLGRYQSYITGLTLTDYRVRILNGGTQAVTRVLIESTDETGDHWTTVGVSANIIDASFQALMDSIVYKLLKSGAPA